MDNQGKNILIIDDETDVLVTLKKLFESKKWAVFTAPTSSVGLPIIEKEKIDIILLDIYLPDASGLDLLKEIKKRHPGLIVIIITGFGYEDKLVNEAMRLGASGYVSKGVGVNELLEVISNALSMRQK